MGTKATFLVGFGAEAELIGFVSTGGDPEHVTVGIVLAGNEKAYREAVREFVSRPQPVGENADYADFIYAFHFDAVLVYVVAKAQWMQARQAIYTTSDANLWPEVGPGPDDF